jgi:hypothetical protein
MALEPHRLPPNLLPQPATELFRNHAAAIELVQQREHFPRTRRRPATEREQFALECIRLARAPREAFKPLHQIVIHKCVAELSHRGAAGHTPRA